MNNEHEIDEQEKAVDEESTTTTDATTTDGEFKVTVRKLEMPVRPRGVLAE